jgi:hypothetical protein
LNSVSTWRQSLVEWGWRRSGADELGGEEAEHQGDNEPDHPLIGASDVGRHRVQPLIKSRPELAELRANPFDLAANSFDLAAESFDLAAESSDFSADASDFAAEFGDFSADAGDFAAEFGHFSADPGDFSADAGDFSAESGDFSAGASDFSSDANEFLMHVLGEATLGLGDLGVDAFDLSSNHLD